MRRIALAACLGALSGVLVSAAAPVFWQVASQGELLKGEVESLSVDSQGRLTLGPSSTVLYEATAPFLWNALTAPDGTLYIGTGNEGQVIRFNPSGASQVYFDGEELEVHALALAPGGGLYVGTSPDGKIYKIDGPGKATVFYDPPDKYIWSLVVDAAGNVFAATGDKGIVYKVTPKGEASTFYATKATHAMALAFSKDGRLLVGTDSPGRVFQLDAAGKPFVLLESAFSEIRTLRVSPDGTIYAAAVSGRPGSGSVPRLPDAPSTPTAPATGQPTVTVSAEITSVTVVADASATTTSPRAPAGSGVGGVYRIQPDGVWDLLWESKEDVPYDLVVDGDGALVVATGNKGKLYRLNGEPAEPTLITRADAQQITAVLRDREGAIVYTTSNPGKLLRLSTTRATSGTYTSEVRDAQTTATWGAIKWHATVPSGTRVELLTRTGNTKAPDETWSAWSTPYANAQGTPIASPRARYLQWRAVLTGSSDTPVLTSVTTAYLPRNLRPRVTSVTVHPPGTVFQKPYPTGDPDIAGYDLEPPDRKILSQAGAANGPQGSGPSLGRRTYQKGLMTFIWRAEDENNDELRFDISYRREGESRWTPLRRGMSDAILVWDTTSVPDGTYLIRVAASDEGSNPDARALTGYMDSALFQIDNTPPAIRLISARQEGTKSRLAFEVRDEQSVIEKVEYSLDGTQWHPVYPKDGIADSRAETFELLVDREPAGRVVVLRATDALNNMGTASPSTTPTAPAAR